jgi:hypothetical protein
MSDLPWAERITVLSIHPDAASRDGVAKLASDLMSARSVITYFMGDSNESADEVLKRLREFMDSE